MRAAQALVKSMLGRRVLKDFGEGAHFGGAVVHVSREAASSKALFTIAYDDGDEEDVYLSELRCILVPSASSPRARAAEVTLPPPSPDTPQTISAPNTPIRPNPVAAHIAAALGRSNGRASARCMPLRSGAKPLQVYCHLCGREYGTRSLAIHVRACLERWPDRQHAYAKQLRRVRRRGGAGTELEPATQPPPGPEAELFPRPRWGVSPPPDYLAYNAEALRIFGVSLGHATTFSEQLNYLEAIERELKASTPPSPPDDVAAGAASQTPAEWVLDTDAVRKELRDTNMRTAEAFTALAQMQRDVDAQTAKREHGERALAAAELESERAAAEQTEHNSSHDIGCAMRCSEVRNFGCGAR